MRPPGVSRWVDQRGTISLAGFRYAVGATFAGEPVEVVVTNGLVEVLHAGVLVATHAQRLKPNQVDRAPRAPVQRRARDATTGLTVTRLADNSGVVSFAGVAYGCGRGWARQSIDVTIVAGSVQLSQGGKIIRVHPIRHDRSRELGAFANPKAAPDVPRRAERVSPTYRNSPVVRVPHLDTGGAGVLLRFMLDTSVPVMGDRLRTRFRWVATVVPVGGRHSRLMTLAPLVSALPRDLVVVGRSQRCWWSWGSWISGLGR